MNNRTIAVENQPAEANTGNSKSDNPDTNRITNAIQAFNRPRVSLGFNVFIRHDVLAFRQLIEQKNGRHFPVR